MHYFKTIHFIRSICFAVFLIIQIIASAQNPLPPIGFWREHLSYQNTIQVVAGNKIYCATTSNIFSIDEENEVERYSTINGLNDVGISAIGFDDFTQQLVIAYTNSNIDVVKNNTVTNISEIKRSSIAGNKKINKIYCKNGVAYACSGLGIILIDLVKYEIKDTWFIGRNGSQLNVNALIETTNFWYAATDDGIKQVLKNSNPSNFANWQTIALNNTSIRQIITVNNQLFFLQGNTIFSLQNSVFTSIYSKQDFTIQNISSTNNSILICEQSITNDLANIVEINTNGSLIQSIQNNNIQQPIFAISTNNQIWICDIKNGLFKYQSNNFQHYLPNGPSGISTGEMSVQNNTLYVASGTLNNWQNTNNKNGIQILNNDEWKNINYINNSNLDSVTDIIAIAIDPTNKSIWAGSFGSGLINITGNNTRIFKQNNSSLQTATVIANPNNCNVSGLAFDKNENLWISNYGAVKNLSVRKKDGNFLSFTIPFTHIENAISDVLIDDENKVWMISPKNNGIFCFNHNNTIENLSDDQWRFFQTGQNRGNLPSNQVNCFAKDKNGFIWVGTDKGIGIIECISNVFTPSCNAILPIVQRDQFAGYLFQNEFVQSIAVDGANRKWIGTKNGVWLIANDGNKILYRFSRENSPLLNNDVQKITIHPTTGEVFFATSVGICSFRSTATTTTNSELGQVFVFPNPVPPNYNGTIAIRGVTNNGWIKIVEPNGRLVFETKALGTQAIWNGKNYKGEKVASGVYLVLARNESGAETLVTKIVYLK